MNFCRCGHIHTGEPIWKDVEDAAALCGIAAATMYAWLSKNPCSVRGKIGFRWNKKLVDMRCLAAAGRWRQSEQADDLRS